MDLLHVGYGNYVPKEKVAIILDINSQTARNIISDAQSNKKLVMLTKRKKTRSLIITSDGFVLRSVLSPITIKRRMEGVESDAQQEEGVENDARQE